MAEAAQIRDEGIGNGLPETVCRVTCGRCRGKIAVPGYRLCWRCLLGSDAPTASLAVVADRQSDLHKQKETTMTGTQIEMAIQIDDYFHGDEPAGVFAWGAFGAEEFLSALRSHLRSEWETDPEEVLAGVEARHVRHLFWDGHLKTVLPTDPDARHVTFLDWGDAGR